MEVFWGCIFIGVCLLAAAEAITARSGVRRLRDDVRYWRRSYEELVTQTGRDLNDGLGLDPRKKGQP